MSIESSPSREEKGEVEVTAQHIDHATTNEKLNALRIDGDGEDHEVEPPMSFKRAMSLIAMGFLWTGSQIPLYLWGSVPPYIYRDIGGLDRWVWFVLGGLLALAAVCPFVGSMSDLLGRRYVALLGAGLLVIATVVATTAKTMNTFIAGMTLGGAGAGIGELTALAVTAELAPTAKRGTYVSILIFTIIPFVPSGIYAQLIASKIGWRYIGFIVCIWNGIGFFMTLFFYFPPPRVNTLGKTKMQVLKEIDYIGGILSIGGMIMFLAGLQWGGYQYPWTSAHVLAPLIVGVVLLIAFCLWEMYGAPHPMFPGRIKQDPRVLLLTLLITFISGMNFFAYLMFWPTQSFNVYGHDPVAVGVKLLPGGMAILTGACVVLWLLSVLKGRNKELMIISSILMTAGTASLAALTRENLHIVWPLLIIGGLGIGGIVVPASIITTIICPDDLIATVSALTLSIRCIGGCIGYCAYFNVFVAKFVPNAVHYIGGTMALKLNITNPEYIKAAIGITSVSLLEELKQIPGIAGSEKAYEMVVYAGQVAYAESYKYVYLASIAAGVVSIIAACFLGDINKYMDNHVAVIIH